MTKEFDAMPNSFKFDINHKKHNPEAQNAARENS